MFDPLPTSEPEAALAFTRELGWHLIPSRGLLIRTNRNKPRWRYDPVRTREYNLDAGYLPEHVNRMLELFVEEDRHGTRIHRRDRVLRQDPELAPPGEGGAGGVARHLE